VGGRRATAGKRGVILPSPRAKLTAYVYCK
jgi:hypothetical protein